MDKTFASGIKDREAEATFSFREAADILDINVSSVSNAVSSGKIETVNTGGKYDKIPASEVIKYGSKWRGMNTKHLREEVQERTNASDNQVLKWVIIGLGITWLINELRKD